jgi:hypothetical protein
MSEIWFYLTLKKIKWLFAYFIILIFIGIPIIIFSLIYDESNCFITLTIAEVALIGGMATAVTGCSIFYLRKLYKCSINKEMSSPINEEQKYRELGIFVYYALRPLFSIVFSLLIHIILRSSAHIITVKGTQLDEGFVFTSMFLSFFGGFAAGDVITYIEEKSKELVATAFNGR